MRDIIYLYGFVPPDTRLPPAGLEGVADRAVELLDGGAGFQAVIGRVPAAEYGGDRLEEGARRLEWVARQGVAHERVVAWFVDRGEILPVRLLTLYSGEDALREEIARRGEQIAAQMERFRGVREWDLKVAYREDRLRERLGAVDPEIARLEEEIAGAAPGRRYLLEKKRDDAARVGVAREARRLGRELLDRLTADAESVRVLDPPRTLEESPVVVSAALLVPAAAEVRLRQLAQERAAELADLGVDVTFSGPWAPYRFVEEAEA